MFLYGDFEVLVFGIYKILRNGDNMILDKFLNFFILVFLYVEWG